MSRRDSYYEEIMDELERLPEKWPENTREMRLHIITNRTAAAWISKRIFQDVERGFVSTELKAKRSPHSVDVDILIRIGEAVAAGLISTALSPLLADIKNRAVRSWRLRRKGKLDNF